MTASKKDHDQKFNYFRVIPGIFVWNSNLPLHMNFVIFLTSQNELFTKITKIKISGITLNMIFVIFSKIKNFKTHGIQPIEK